MGVTAIVEHLPALVLELVDKKARLIVINKYYAIEMIVCIEKECKGIEIDRKNAKEFFNMISQMIQ